MREHYRFQCGARVDVLLILFDLADMRFNFGQSPLALGNQRLADSDRLEVGEEFLLLGDDTLPFLL